jgi:hypothetical protein
VFKGLSLTINLTTKTLIISGKLYHRICIWIKFIVYTIEHAILVKFMITVKTHKMMVPHAYGQREYVLIICIILVILV